MLLLAGAGRGPRFVLLKVTLLYTACAEGAVTLLTAVLLTCTPAITTVHRCEQSVRNFNRHDAYVFLSYAILLAFE